MKIKDAKFQAGGVVKGPLNPDRVPILIEPNEMHENKTKEQKQEFIERNFNRAKRAQHIKQRKRVEWNGEIFESITALNRRMQMSGYNPNINKYIKEQKTLRGHVPKFVGKE